MSKMDLSVAVEMLNLIKSFRYLKDDDPELVIANPIAQDIASVVQRWLASGIIQYPHTIGYFPENGDSAPVVPSHTLDAIQNYIERKTPPGDFLGAVLCNNLKEAYVAADDKNRPAMEEIVRYLYNYAPIQCWGSEEKVHAWLNEPAQEGDEDHDSENNLD